MEEATLLFIMITQDEDGFFIEQKKEIEIFVTEKSVTRSEFYNALRNDIAVKTILEARIEDFELSEHIVDGKRKYATQIRYNGEVYDIVRTFKKSKSKIEFVCS